MTEMGRPFLLYHWSPRARRNGILRHGLCPHKRGNLSDWRPPYVCFCAYPNTAWALSATHSGKRGQWDLWCVWSDRAGEYVTRNSGRNPRRQWHLTEFRTLKRIPKSKIWFVGSREFVPRRKRGAALQP